MKRLIGWLYLAFGTLMAANAIVAGPHAFGGGWSAVILMTGAGSVMVLCGLYILWQNRRATRRRSRGNGLEP